jgi:hypothetical protein
MRRHLKPGSPPFRRMLCTGDLSLLNSNQGRVALNFRPAYNQPRFNPVQKNLLITWDIFMQDYRCVNMDACELVTLVPNAGFWKFFNERLVLMSPQQKIKFMNS